MQTQLLSIFKAITPDNIKNLPLISDSMEIFIELLSENSYISSDIKKALSEETTASIGEELPKIYLNDYYSMIENLKTNKTVVNKFKRWNEALNPNLYPIGMPIISDKLIVNYFIIGEVGDPLVDPNSEDGTDKWNISPLSGKLDILSHNILQNKAENYYINRKFKESKGLKKSIQFIYDIVNEYMVNPDERRPLIFKETGRPFEIELISGSMDKDIYNESVAYLSHPLGFTYEYVYVSELNFTDNFGLKKFYDIKMLEVRCLNGNVETYNKNVIYIEERLNYLKIVFFDGTYLLQENDAVKYFDSNDTIIKFYSPEYHCSIFLEYEILYETRVTDSIKFSDKSESYLDNIIISENANYNIYTRLDQNNFIIGLSIIGEKYISNDSDQYEGVKVKDYFYNPNLVQNYVDNFNIIDIFKSKEEILAQDNINISDLHITTINSLDLDLYNYQLSDNINYSNSLINNDVLNITDMLTTYDSNFINDIYGSSITDIMTNTSSIQNTDNFSTETIIDSNSIYSLNVLNDNVSLSDIITSYNDLKVDETLDTNFADSSTEEVKSSTDDSINIQNSLEEFDIQII